ncbi:MAG: hypothetical protein WAV31_00480 [Candidatus Moraniibacteriota bacterium]
MYKINIFIILAVVAFFGLFNINLAFAVPCDGHCAAVCESGFGAGHGDCPNPAEPVCCGESFGLPDRSMYEVFADTANFLLSLAGILTLLGFVIAGFQYFFAVGDEKASEKAKKIMTASAIGLFIILSALVVIYTVTDIFY